jgi:hypothetical protein
VIFLSIIGRNRNRIRRLRIINNFDGHVPAFLLVLLLVLLAQALAQPISSSGSNSGTLTGSSTLGGSSTIAFPFFW